jgi:hypothetical protein
MASEYSITVSEEEGAHDEQSTVSGDEEGEDDEDGDGDGGATTLTIDSDGRIAAQGSDEINYTTRALLGVLDRVPTAAHARLVADCEVRPSGERALHCWHIHAVPGVHTGCPLSAEMGHPVDVARCRHHPTQSGQGRGR